MGEAFTLQFGEAAIQILCEDAGFGSLIHQHFQHCLVEPSPKSAVTYRIVPSRDGRWDLHRDHRPVLKYAQQWRLLETLMQDMTIHLTAYTRRSAVFHAAGVVYQGRGLMLCGETGSGKSTLAAWLICQGLKFLGDEIIAIDPEDLEMIGFPRPIVLKKGSDFIYRGESKGAAPERIGLFPNETAWIDADWLRPGAVLRTAPLAGLVFPRFQAGGQFQAGRLSAAEAAFQIMQHLINAKNLPGRGFSNATAIASQYPAYRLVYGALTIATIEWFDSIV